jgi:hypothetical protein
MAKQISLLLENVPGRLARVTELLGKNGIDIRAVSVNETSDFSILRLIVNGTDKAVACLEKEFTVSVSDILLIELEDRPGSLHELAKALAGVNIEYLYDVTSHKQKTAIIAIKPRDVSRAAAALKDRFRVLDDSSLSG